MKKEELKINLINPKQICSKIESFIRKKVNEFERDGVILGISGGLDSAVAAYLCVKALGKEKVFGLLMPEQDSPPESLEDAKLIASSLGIKFKVEDLTEILKMYGIYNLAKIPSLIPSKRMKESLIKGALNYYRKKTGESPFSAALLGIKKNKPYAKILRKITAYMRAKHRARALMWYKYAEIYNLLVVGCCNKSEDMVGWFVKWGDSASDISPLGGLYKTQVRQLAAYLRVPEKILIKIPSPDMLPGITDEYAIGLSYKTLDLILHCLEKKLSDKTIAKQFNINQKTINYVKLLVKKSAHMRELPPWLKI